MEFSDESIYLALKMILKSPCEALGISSKCNVVSGVYLYVLVRQQGMPFGF